jgi:predicted transposase YbfD/YdcC
LNSVIRQHWGIENKLHWVLDVAPGPNSDRLFRFVGSANSQLNANSASRQKSG